MGTLRRRIVDSLHANPRVFNDFSTSNLTITNNYPTRVIIDDRNLVDDGMGGSFANRHDLLLSSDAGASSTVFNINDIVTIQGEVKLEAGSNSPRKEAGIRFNSAVTGDALFIINSDAGEIVLFGGNGPFHLFGNNASGDGYTPGSTILMGIIYRGDTIPRTTEYFIDRNPAIPGGIETTGPLSWTSLEGGPVDFTAGFYTQVGPAGANDFVTATFSNIDHSGEGIRTLPFPAMSASVQISAAPAGRRRFGATRGWSHGAGRTTPDSAPEAMVSAI